MARGLQRKNECEEGETRPLKIPIDRGGEKQFWYGRGVRGGRSMLVVVVGGWCGVGKGCTPLLQGLKVEYIGRNFSPNEKNTKGKGCRKRKGNKFKANVRTRKKRWQEKRKMKPPRGHRSSARHNWKK